MSFTENISVNAASLKLTSRPASVDANFKVEIVTTAANIKLVTYKIENFYTGISPVKLLGGMDFTGRTYKGVDFTGQSLLDGINTDPN